MRNISGVCSGMGQAFAQAHFGQGEKSQPIWLDDVICDLVFSLRQ